MQERAHDGSAQPPERSHRREAATFLLRSLLTSTAILVGYFVLPLKSRLAVDTVLELLGGLVVFTLLMLWQIRGILRSTYPGARAVGALMVSVPLFLAIFSATYYLMNESTPESFSQLMSRMDALYFTVTVFATVGFGDIVPLSETARVVVTVQMVGDLILVGLIARVILGAVQESRARHRGEEAP